MQNHDLIRSHLTSHDGVAALREYETTGSVEALVDHVAALDLTPAPAPDVAGLVAENARLRDQLRLIELLGYREGEQLGWLVAHMRGVANDALEGRTSAHMWRLFPRHRPAALAAMEAPNG